MPALNPLFLAVAAAPWAMAEVPADPLGDLARAKSVQQMGNAATDSILCPKNGDSIVVCGRRMGGGGRSSPDDPVPGAPTRLVAGEAPSAMAAISFSECHRLCQQPLRIDVIGTARTVRNLVGRLFD